MSSLSFPKNVRTIFSDRTLEARETREAEAQPKVLSARLLDSLCIGFALWTVCCFAVVSAGRGLGVLLPLFGLTIGSCVLGRYLLLRGRSRTSIFPPDGSRDLSPAEPTGPEPIHWRAFRLLGLIAGSALTIAFQTYGDAHLLWWGGVVLLGLALAVVMRTPPHVSFAARSPRREVALWGLAAACSLVALVSHRPDLDDAFYVNLAVAAADEPDRPLLAADTMHGVEGLAIHLPVYRVHSFEILNGAVSYLTGIPAIYCFHWISAAAAAALVPLALARLFRILLPTHWLLATTTTIFLLLVVGETHRWYGNFAFVRIWQGKAIYLSVLLPLVYTYSIEFARRPSKRGWVLLSASQIAAVGCTSSALWAAPVSAGMAVLSAVRPTRKGLATVGLASFGSTFVLAAGWMIKKKVQVAVTGYENLPDAAFDESLNSALTIVLGDGRLASFGIMAVLVAWTVLPRGPAQRFAVTLPLLFLIFLFNPYATKWLVANVVGGSYWRSLWALPIPVLMTFVLISPWLAARRFRPLLGSCRLVGLATLTGFGLLVPEYTALSPENRVEVKLPGLKVPYPAYDQAAALNSCVQDGSYVVAPPQVSAWVPTFHDHAYPLAVRWYLKHGSLGVRNRRARIQMSKFAGGAPGRKGRGEQDFRWGIDAYDLDGALLTAPSPTVDRARSILKSAGFGLVLRRPAAEIWVRGESEEAKSLRLGEDGLFGSGFESGNLMGWSSPE